MFKYGLPFDVSYLSLDDSLFLVQQWVDGLNAGLVESVKIGDTAQATAIRNVIKSQAIPALAQMRADATAIDAPNAVMVQLDAFSTEALKLIDTTATGVAGTVGVLPSILFPVLVVALILAYFYFGGKVPKVSS